MQLNADNLEAALKPLQSVLGSRSSVLQVLNNVYLEPDDGGDLSLVATDLDTTVQTTCPVDGEPSRACLSGKQLYDLARGIDGAMELEVEENWWATIDAGETTARVVGVHPDDYPEYDLPDDADWQTVTGDELARLVDATLHAVSDDDARANLTGAHLDVEEGDKAAHLAATSTDGHRLARLVSRQPFDPEAMPEDGAIVPKDAWSMMGGMGRDAQNVKIAVAEEKVYARGAGRVLSARLIEGTFPDFRQVTPDRSSEVAVFDRDELADAIDFISMFSSNKTKSVRLTFRDNELELYASDPDLGESTTAVPCTYEVPDGEPIKLAANHGYLEDALKSLEGAEVEVDPIDTLSPLTFCPPGDEREDYRIVMPTRI